MELEIWSDIACPWCYLGKRRMDLALERFEHASEVRITWRSFELDPNAPAEIEGDAAEVLSRKYGMTVEQARASQRQLAATAAADGLDFHFERVRMANTFDGHRLVHLAAEHGLADQLKDRLMSAHFTDGLLVSDAETLRALAAEVGVPDEEVADLLAGDRFADQVRADERLATQLGVAAVPTFIVDRSVGGSGAREPELLLAMLQTAWDRSRQGVSPEP